MADNSRSPVHNPLFRIAHEVMQQRGLLPEFSTAAVAQLNRIAGPSTEKDSSIRDLTSLLWASVDNDDSRDLDQLSVAEPMPDGGVKILVAIADVDALVKKNTPIDDHADAAREALDRPDLARRKRRAARRRHRNGGGG
jgi:exoribonuclease-2